MKYYTITSDDLMDCKVELDKAIERLGVLEASGRLSVDDKVELALARGEMYQVLAVLDLVVLRARMEG